MDNLRKALEMAHGKHTSDEIVSAAKSEIERLREALKKLFYRHPPLPALTDEEYEMIRPLISESSPGETEPTPKTGPPLPDALPECLFRYCPTEDKCKANGCATPRSHD